MTGKALDRFAVRVEEIGFFSVSVKFFKEIVMSNLHKVMGSMIGYLAAAPTLSHVGDKGTAKAFYQVIRNIRWHDQETGEKHERIVSIPLASWGKQAEND